MPNVPVLLLPLQGGVLCSRPRVLFTSSSVSRCLAAWGAGRGVVWLPPLMLCPGVSLVRAAAPSVACVLVVSAGSVWGSRPALRS